ncbi:MAG: hypothetical protein HY904_08620 [Deltaproteobacteria bacterium]|nr:hypothetical protein [Deltaproteobacteria bacterium]
MRRLRGVVLGVTWMVAGCTGRTGTDAGTTTTDAGRADAGLSDAGGQDGGRTGTFADLRDGYCTRAAALWCASMAECGCVAPEGGALSVTACETFLLQRCQSGMADVGARVEAGALVVLPDFIEACLAASARSMGRCEPPRDDTTRVPCASMVAAPVELGGTCTGSICARGAGFCDETHTCTALPAAGQPCTSACAAGARCAEGTCRALLGPDGGCADDHACADHQRCVHARCTALAPPGAACAADESCAAALRCRGGHCEVPDGGCSVSDEPCANLATCAVPQTRRCATPGGEDAGCAQDQECTGGLFCEYDGGRCHSLPADGAPCGNGVWCRNGLGCGMETGRCAALPGDGGACALGVLGPFLCAEGLACRETGSCGAFPEDGEACAIPNTCAPGLGCDFTANGSVCAQRRPAGGACQNDQVCQDGLFCDFHVGTCAALRGVGAPCSSGNECGSGLTCTVDVPGNPHCLPIPGLAEPCLFDCAPGLYCRSVPGDGVCLAPICRAVLGG